MCVRQRGHKKNFSFLLPIFRQGARKMVRSLLAARTHSIVPPKLLLSSPTRNVSLLEGCHQLDREDFHEPDGFRLVVSKGQWHRGVEWIPDENLPSSCALSSDQFQSQLRHFRCPIGEVSNDQPRAWLPGISKSCQNGRHKAEWPVLRLTKLPKTQGHPSGKAHVI